MGTERRLHVFCYDVSADALRRRVSDALEEVAVRVQGSVFEARLTSGAAAAVVAQIGTLLNRGDSLRVYVVPPAAIPACHVVGRGPSMEENDFYLL